MTDDASQVDSGTLLDCIARGGETGRLARAEIARRLTTHQQPSPVPVCGDNGRLCPACSLPAHELTQVPGCGGPLPPPEGEDDVAGVADAFRLLVSRGVASPDSELTDTITLRAALNAMVAFAALARAGQSEYGGDLISRETTAQQIEGARFDPAVSHEQAVAFIAQSVRDERVTPSARGQGYGRGVADAAAVALKVGQCANTRGLDPALERIAEDIEQEILALAAHHDGEA